MEYPILTSEEAAAFVQHGDMIGIGGFGPAGSPKVIVPAIAARAREEHGQGRPFKIDVMTGASIGASCDGELAAADAIDRRMPFSVNTDIRRAYNEGRVRFSDLNLSDNARQLRLGFNGDVTWGIVEACDIVEVNGKYRIYPTAGIGIAPTICRLAKKGVFVELNRWHSTSIIGLHDIYEIEDPWLRTPIPITRPSQRIGCPYIEVDANRIAGVVEVNVPDEQRPMAAGTPETEKIGRHLANFFLWNMKRGYINGNRLILQSGVGSGANAVIGALGRCEEVPDFNIYTEVFQDEPLRLLKEGRILTASTGALTICTENLAELYASFDDYRERLVVRPSEISNSPEIILRLGICSMNTAIEVDIYGHVNSTKICGSKMMNGVGGSCDYTNASMLSTFTCSSTQKGGKISSIVPFCSHIDHTEHFVDAIITEYGVADLRGKCATEKADALIGVAHPDYRPLLREYQRLASMRGGHTPHLLSAAFAMHDTYLRKGDMRLTDWAEYIK